MKGLFRLKAAKRQDLLASTSTGAMVTSHLMAPPALSKHGIAADGRPAASNRSSASIKGEQLVFTINGVAFPIPRKAYETILARHGVDDRSPATIRADLDKLLGGLFPRHFNQAAYVALKPAQIHELRVALICAFSKGIDRWQSPPTVRP